ncbi:hypothetical protein CYK16_00480 [Streptococcus oralis subsp. dentisani]|uniref:Uncharacterized protein n=2 Tax=Streptococcus TaxID=1301 RepID=A0A2I1UFP3_STROR|nr:MULTISPECIES: hypothetical protein [Streptococcus]KXA58038.1 hypothetical protein HMPREF3228_01923 [Streptococcus mitis]MDK7307927.1 hypothetical protein [Streptococcus oralis]MDK7311644.1 hypothetical protein [Streptococcus oralis]MDU3980613.1 hypothetical protein [Streptococcus mitis]PLA04691.1 hypothetical protein CYK16_00480 [Streptococcus oralis subsp. dentisani]
MGAIMEFATEKQIASFLSTCHIEGQRNFLMAFKKKTWLKSFIDFFVIGGAYYVQSNVKPKILAFTPKGIYLMDVSDVTENRFNQVLEMPWNQVKDFAYKPVLNTVRLNWNYQNKAYMFSVDVGQLSQRVGQYQFNKEHYDYLAQQDFFRSK